MKRYSFLLATLSVAIVSCISEADFTVSENEEASALETKITGRNDDAHIEGTLLLYLSEEATARIENGETEAVISEMFEGVEFTGFEPAIHPFPKNGKLARELGLHRWFAVSFNEDISARSFAEIVAVRPEISAIQFNSTPKLASDCISIPFQHTKAHTETVDQAIPFNDPINSYQWNLLNTGNRNVATSARAGADVGVVDAWKLTGGSSDVIVAICDAPVKYTHPDLADAMWVNEAEKYGTAGVDDDGNGYIDDVHGYNFYSMGSIKWKVNGESGHGTHVAGIIGAVNDNGIGVSSVAGGNGVDKGVRLMSCQIFEGGYSGGDEAIANALIYAADNGACIAQCSYGFDASTYRKDNQYINAAPFEYSAIKYFIDPSNCNHPSLSENIAIYAAGNESYSNSGYPGALPICISVTAFGPDFLPGGYTNYGNGCNIAAPGGDYWIGAASDDDNISQILSTCISEVSGEYSWMQGTSMACPHVSGVAALGISYAAKIGKKFAPGEFHSLLLTSVNDMNKFLTAGQKPYGNKKINLSTYNKKMGTGAIDAWKFLMQIEGIPSVMVECGVTTKIDLSNYFGESFKDLTYLQVTVDDGAKEALGLASVPKVNNGAIYITCTNNGSAKLTISAIAGGEQLGGGNSIGGTEISREISILSRGIHTNNGGWL